MKISKERIVTGVEIRLAEPNGSVPTLTVRALRRTEAREFLAADFTRQRALLLECVRDWSGFQREDGTPLPFSREVLEDAIEDVMLGNAIGEALLAASTGVGLRKNS